MHRVLAVLLAVAALAITPIPSYACGDARPLDGSVPRHADGSLRLAGGTGCPSWPGTDPAGDYALLLLAHGYGNRLVPLTSSRMFDGPSDRRSMRLDGAVARPDVRATSTIIIPVREPATAHRATGGAVPDTGQAER